jgi:hypothetical protein
MDLPAKGFLVHNAAGVVDLTSFDLTSFVAMAGTTILSATGVNGSDQVTAIAEIGGSSVAVLITP